MGAVARILRIVLEVWTMLLVVALAGVVVSAVVARYVFNASFVWYDEVASVLLAWITFYGAALAALRRRHLGFAGLMVAAPPRLRPILFGIGEAVFYAVFIVLAWWGYLILDILGNETLVSLEVPLRITQSAVPVGCALVVLAHFLSMPEAYRQLAAGRSSEDEEIAEEIARAERSAGPT